MKKLIVLFLLLSFNSFSQEIVSDLISNSALSGSKEIIKENKSALSVPFIDDFSNNSYYPDSNLWKDNSVFINRNYGVNPITIGVATFDGLNENGRAYNITLTGTDSENADTLTSQKIDLSSIDTAYFMLGKDKVEPNYQDLKSLPVLYDRLFKECPNLEVVATTLRYSVSASHQRIGGILYDGKKIFNADVKEVTPVVDRVGSGDAFMGGLVYGLVNDKNNKQRALDIAVAACCLKHTISGDYNLITLDEIEKLISGDFSGKVSR